MKQAFDDRSQTTIRLNSRHLSTEPIEVDLKSQFQWSTILQVINSSDFLIEYGATTYIQPTTIYIAIGTTKGYVVVFNYRQSIAYILMPDIDDDASEYLPDVSVSSVSFSSDLTRVACGNVQGMITIWELTNAKPYYIIPPVTTEQRFQLKEGHLKVPIINIEFLDNHRLVTIDSLGLINYHVGFKKLLAKTFVTHKVMGPSDIRDPKPDDIFDNGILPLGSSHQVTDHIGMTAIITSQSLIIISITSLNNPNNLHLKTHGTIAKPKTLKPTTGCLNWFPCMDNNGTVVNARLAYSWDNYLYVVELDNTSFPPNFMQVINDLKDKDKGIPTLNILKKCFLKTPDKISSLKWISPSILLVFSPHDLTILHYNGSLSHINHEPLPDLKDLKWDGAIKVVKNRVILLEPGKVKVGKTISWNDKLVELIKIGDYETALKTAWYFYTSTDHQLVLFDVPERSIIEPYLKKILDGGIGHLNFTRQVLEVYFKVIALIEYNMDPLFEAVDRALFFDTIEPFLVTGEIRTISPTILRQLIIYYTDQKKDLVTEILCTIDVTYLDIDLSIQLCNKNGLNDAVIFIYNYLLHDYATPFYNFLNNLQNDVFLYLSYILTGRQYPIDQYISFNDEGDAKDQILNILFTSSDDELLFPNLTKLLQYNSFETLSMLNEFFEDSSLNEGDLNRQYIIDAILDIYASSPFSNLDKCHLSIFIGRNYPKYTQFLRLSDSILSQILDNLINYATTELKVDCELALQSLVSVFEPVDETRMIEKLTKGKFWTVLMGIYRSKHQWDKFLKVYLDHGEMSTTVLEEIISKYHVSSLIKENFERVITVDIKKMAGIIDNYLPNLHNEILKLDEPLQFEYLQQVTPQHLMVNYIALMMEFEPHEVYNYLVTHNFTVEESEKLETIVANDIPSLTVVLNNQNRYEDSLNIILDSLTHHPDNFDLFVEVIKFVDHDEQYWIQFINILINHHRNLVSPAFKIISDRKFNDHSGFQAIIDHLLNDSEIINVKELIMEIMITYSYESEILAISSKILNVSIRHDIQVITGDKLRGWPGIKHCTSCEQRIGHGDYLAWEAKECKRLDLWERKPHGERLVIFKCGHGYHYDCLHRLGSSVCVLDSE